jgi:hypothetical protein
MSYAETWSLLACRKGELMRALNENKLNKKEWQNFISDCRKAGMLSMASDMERRLENYER